MRQHQRPRVRHHGRGRRLLGERLHGVVDLERGWRERRRHGIVGVQQLDRIGVEQRDGIVDVEQRDGIVDVEQLDRFVDVQQLDRFVDVQHLDLLHLQLQLGGRAGRGLLERRGV